MIRTFTRVSVALRLVGHGFHEMREVVDVTERALRSASASHDEQVKRTLRKVRPEARDDYAEFASQEQWMVSETTPDRLRRALAITIHSDFERMLLRLADLAFSEEICLEPPDFPTPSLTNIHEYLRKQALVPQEEFGRRWSFIKEVERLRHLLVHNSGKLKIRRFAPLNHQRAFKLVERFVRAHADLGTDDMNMVKINARFLRSMIDAMEECVNGVAEWLNEHVPPHKAKSYVLSGHR